MKFSEYAMLKTFEKVFDDVGEVEEYGFSSWLDLATHIQAEKLNVLLKLNGVKTCLIEAYAGSYLPDLLQSEYEWVLYIVEGIKTFDVTF